MQLTAQDKKAAREGFAYVVIRGGKRVCYASTLGEAKRECGKTGRVVSISGMRYAAQNPFRGSLNVRNPSLNVRNPSAVAAPSRLWKKSKSKVPHFTSVTEDGELTYHLTSKDGVTWEAIIEPYRGKQWSLEKGSFAKVAKAAEKDLRAYNKSVVGSAISFENPSLNVRNPSINVRNPRAKGWRVTPRANTVGTHMLAGDYNNIDEAGDAWEICYATFPPARQNRDMRYKGYGPEWIFTAPNGQVFTVYDRSDVPRIGGVQGQYTFKDLLAWLRTQKKRNPSLNVRNPSSGAKQRARDVRKFHQGFFTMPAEEWEAQIALERAAAERRDLQRLKARPALHRHKGQENETREHHAREIAASRKHRPALPNPSLNVRNPSAADVGHSVGKHAKYAARGAGRVAKSAWHGTKSFLGSAYSSFKKHNPSINVR